MTFVKKARLMSMISFFFAVGCATASVPVSDEPIELEDCKETCKEVGMVLKGINIRPTDSDWECVCELPTSPLNELIE